MPVYARAYQVGSYIRYIPVIISFFTVTDEYTAVYLELPAGGSKLPRGYAMVSDIVTRDS
jgi:hypothetical protein